MQGMRKVVLYIYGTCKGFNKLWPDCMDSHTYVFAVNMLEVAMPPAAMPVEFLYAAANSSLL